MIIVIHCMALAMALFGCIFVMIPMCFRTLSMTEIYVMKLIMGHIPPQLGQSKGSPINTTITG